MKGQTAQTGTAIIEDCTMPTAFSMALRTKAWAEREGYRQPQMAGRLAPTATR